MRTRFTGLFGIDAPIVCEGMTPSVSTPRGFGVAGGQSGGLVAGCEPGGCAVVGGVVGDAVEPAAVQDADPGAARTRMACGWSLPAVRAAS